MAGQAIAAAAAVLSIVGMGLALAGWRAAARFAAEPPSPDAPPEPITVLKPLHGDEPGLEEGLESTIRQDHPAFQIVFGVQDPADPAIAVVERLRARQPDADIDLVVDPALHGANRKVCNLINMYPRAKHGVLVIADSDLLVAPGWLRSMAAALARPGVGLSTALYAGMPLPETLATRMGATQITHAFLPGALLARALGRQDCLGAAMCLRRETLERIGGLRALVPHLADDNVLGRRVRSLGLGIALADQVVATTVPETSWRGMLRHELRWARTIRALEPAGFAASILQYPLFWGMLAGCAHPWGWAVFAAAWLARAAAGRGVDRAAAKGLAFRCPVWLLPAREALTVGVMLASYLGTRVDWRGHGLDADTPPRPATPDRDTALR